MDFPPPVEGIARVIMINGDSVWLEPEQTTSCGHCASSASCSTAQKEAAGIGTVASRLAARRFKLDSATSNDHLKVGERIVIGVSERSLLGAALTAYGLPLLTALIGGGLGQSWLLNDLGAMVGMAGGLGIGLLLARLIARQLAAHGELTPRYLRRARPDETCGTL